MAMQSGFIQRIRDIMRMDAGINGDAQRIEQMVWMLFLKVYDAKEDEWEPVSYTHLDVYKRQVILFAYRFAGLRHWNKRSESVAGRCASEHPPERDHHLPHPSPAGRRGRAGRRRLVDERRARDADAARAGAGISQAGRRQRRFRAYAGALSLIHI